MNVDEGKRFLICTKDRNPFEKVKKTFCWTQNKYQRKKFFFHFLFKQIFLPYFVFEAAKSSTRKVQTDFTPRSDSNKIKQKKGLSKTSSR